MRGFPGVKETPGKRLHHDLACRLAAGGGHGSSAEHPWRLIPAHSVPALGAVLDVVAIEACNPLDGKIDHCLLALAGKLAAEIARDIDRAQTRSEGIGKNGCSLSV